MELTRKTPEELTEIARGIVTNRIYAAWTDEALEYSFSFLLMAIAGSAKEDEDMSWLQDIGLVYQDIDQAGDRGINGYPMFFSGQLLHREDRIPLHRECLRLAVALGEQDQEVLDQFDADLEDFKSQLAQTAVAAEEKKEEGESSD